MKLEIASLRIIVTTNSLSIKSSYKVQKTTPKIGKFSKGCFLIELIDDRFNFENFIEQKIRNIVWKSHLVYLIRQEYIYTAF